MDQQTVGRWLPALSQLVEKCLDAGIDPNLFIAEKVQELTARKRIKLLPPRDWFNNHFSEYFDFASRALGRELTDSERHDPQRNLREQAGRSIRLHDEARLQPDEQLKQSLLSSCGGHCECCGARLTLDSMQVDHRLPWAAGGDNSRDNLQAICALCNEGKAHRIEGFLHPTMSEWKEELADLATGIEELKPGKRFSILARDGFACVNCRRAAPDVTLSIELQIPRQHGGQRIYDNCVTLCETCAIEHRRQQK